MIIPQNIHRKSEVIGEVGRPDLRRAVGALILRVAGGHQPMKGTQMYLTDATKYAVTAQRMRARIRRRGTTCQGYLLWTQAEDELCRSLYPDYAALQKSLPGRSYNSIRSRCRELGIQRKLPAWTAAEQSKLRRMYKTAPRAELAAAFPTRPERSLATMARRIGVQRPRSPYKPTGIPLLDELRAECRRQNINMVDLDQYTRGKSYFTQKSWRGRRRAIRYDLIVRGILELGGKIHVEWSEE
ncbi:hypothetical protein [Nitratireductor thuwali]|uniref:hypothetical protein n=1 Tax=Nitratireductor thuwali TaxID=2267699 RepID=UPI0030CD9558